MVFTLKQMERLCKPWAKRLHLQEWRIALKIVRQQEIDGAIARTTYSLERNDAIIRLSNPIDYLDYPLPYDMEQSLVHELLHLKFAAVAHPQTDIEKVLWEQVVESLSWCLVEGWRREKRERG